MAEKGERVKRRRMRRLRRMRRMRRIRRMRTRLKLGWRRTGHMSRFQQGVRCVGGRAREALR